MLSEGTELFLRRLVWIGSRVLGTLPLSWDEGTGELVTVTGLRLLVSRSLVSLCLLFSLVFFGGGWTLYVPSGPADLTFAVFNSVLILTGNVVQTWYLLNAPTFAVWCDAFIRLNKRLLRLFPELEGTSDGLELVWRLMTASGLGAILSIPFGFLLLLEFGFSIFGVWSSADIRINGLLALCLAFLYTTGWYVAVSFASTAIAYLSATNKWLIKVYTTERESVEKVRGRELRVMLRAHSLMHRLTVLTVRSMTTFCVYMAYLAVIVTFFCLIGFWDSVHPLVFNELLMLGLILSALILTIFYFAFKITETSLAVGQGSVRMSAERRKFMRSFQPLWWELAPFLVVQRDTFIRDLHDIILNGVITLLLNFK